METRGMTLRAAWALCALLIAGIATASDCGIENGDFETGDLSGWTVSQPAGSGWDVYNNGSTAVIQFNAGNPMAAGAASIAQSIECTTGGDLLVDVDMGTLGGSGCASAIGQIFIDDVVVWDANCPTSEMTVTIPISSGVHELKFGLNVAVVNFGEFGWLFVDNIVNTASGPETVQWVGYQNDCGGDNNPDVGSFFHGDNWLGFVPPGPGSRVFFGTEYDTPPMGYPNTVHFGDFCFEAGVCSAVQIHGGTATFEDFVIKDDSWILDFTSGSSGCVPDSADDGSLDIMGLWEVGTIASQSAQVAVLNGSMSMRQLRVGRYGSTGSMTLQGGAHAFAQEVCVVGEGNGTVGSLTVTGSGTSYMQATQGVIVGAGTNGQGSLLISDQAVVDLPEGILVGREGASGSFVADDGADVNIGNDLYIGASGVGDALIEGPGTTVDLMFTLRVGEGFPEYIRSGEVEVNNGAIVKANAAWIGESEGATGSVTLDGAGTLLDLATNCTVGQRGDGTLTMTDGAQFESSAFFVGQFESSTGTASLSDPGTGATVTGGLFVGDTGVGTLVILSGATVSAADGRVGSNFVPGDGTVTVTGAGSRLDLATFLDVGTVSAGRLNVGVGSVVQAGNSIHAGGSGTGTITLANGTLDAPTIEIREGGCLEGEGSVLGNVINTAGKVSPGDSSDPYGEFDVDGDLEFTPESKPAEFDAAGPAPSDDRDKINVSGNARLDGTLVLNLRDGYVPAPGDTLHLIDYGSLALAATARGTSDFDCFVGLDVGDSLSFSPVAGANQYLLIAGAASGNQAPVALPDSGATPADVPLTLDLVANDSDPDPEGLRIYDVDLTGTAGTVTIDGDFTVTYTPDPAVLGTDTFSYRVTDCVGGTSTAMVTIEVDLATTSVPEDPEEGDSSDLTTSLRALTVAPNPFGGTTQVRWSQTSTEKVEISVYNVRGERVKRLVHGDLGAGEHEVTWSGRDEAGHPVPAGVYFVRYSAGSANQAERVVVLR